MRAARPIPGSTLALVASTRALPVGLAEPQEHVSAQAPSVTARWVEVVGRVTGHADAALH